MGTLIIASNAVPSTSRNEEILEAAALKQLYRRLEVERKSRVLLVTTAETIGAMHPHNISLRVQIRRRLGLSSDVIDWRRIEADVMMGYQCVVIGGGNTYRLAHALHTGKGHHSPATVLSELIEKRKTLIIGISAGGIICTPRISSVKIQDPFPFYLSKEWQPEFAQGLNWHTTEVFPHYNALWRNGSRDEKMIAAYEKDTGFVVHRLRDGEFIIQPYNSPTQPLIS